MGGRKPHAREAPACEGTNPGGPGGPTLSRSSDSRCPLSSVPAAPALRSSPCARMSLIFLLLASSSCAAATNVGTTAPPAFNCRGPIVLKIRATIKSSAIDSVASFAAAYAQRRPGRMEQVSDSFMGEDELP